MPVVWNDISAKYHVDWDYSTEVFEPKKNIEVACAYLAWLRYDFLPRHFAAFDPNPVAPVVLVRDRDLGVPPREGPRIVVASADKPAPVKEVASASDKTPLPKSSVVHEEHSNDDSASAKTSSKKQPAIAGADDDAKGKGDSGAKVKPGSGIAMKSDHGKIEITMSDSDTKNVSRSSEGGKTRVTIRGNGSASGASHRAEIASSSARTASNARAVKVDNKEIKAAQASVKKKDASLAEDIPRKRDKDHG
jgi:hypothetical protein